MLNVNSENVIMAGVANWRLRPGMLNNPYEKKDIDGATGLEGVRRKVGVARLSCLRELATSVEVAGPQEQRQRDRETRLEVPEWLQD